MLDTFLIQQLADVFGGLDGGGTYQDRPALGLAVLDVGDDRLVLLFLGQVDQVVEVLARDRLVGRDHHHVQTIDLAELESLGIGGTGHAGQLVVETEVVLESGRGEGLALGLNVHPLLRFDSLVQALGETATRHGTAGVLVDQDHLAVLHDVLDIAVEQLVRTQAGVNVSQQTEVVRGIEAFTFGQQTGSGEHLLDVLVAGLVEFDLTRFLIDLVVTFLSHHAFLFLDVLLEARDQLVDLDVQLGAVFGLTGDDQRGTGFVDEDGVDFVDHGKIQLALELVFQAEGHVVAQVVETEFVVGAVGDIGGVGGALLFRRLEGGDDTHGQAEELVQRAHPVGVTTGQVFVDRDHVHALAGQCVEIDRQGTYQGLALTGTHLGDLAFMQGHAADQLHIEVAHAHHSLTGLTGHSEGFGKQLVEGFALSQTALELFGLATQLLVREGDHLLFEDVDGLHRLDQAFDFTLILASEKFFKQRRKHIDRIFRRMDGGRRKSRPGSQHGCGRKGHSTRKTQGGK